VSTAEPSFYSAGQSVAFDTEISVSQYLDPLMAKMTAVDATSLGRCAIEDAKMQLAGGALSVRSAKLGEDNNRGLRGGLLILIGRCRVLIHSWSRVASAQRGAKMIVWSQ
jgi:hypothetical protein